MNPDTKAELHKTDVHVGHRIRERRILMGLSQEKLAEYLGVTFQQQQKRESGANRVSASALHLTAEVLDVSITYFFEGLGDGKPAPLGDEFSDRETLEHVRQYRKIKSPDTRKRLYELTKSIAKDEAKALLGARRTDHPTMPEIQRAGS